MRNELIAKNDPKSPVSEVFRAFRTNVQYMTKSSKARTIVVTSTVQGEGKSWIVSNLAITFAQTGKNVIIVDSDMRRPKQHRLFGIRQYPGLSNYLSGVMGNGNEQGIKLSYCVQRTEIPNLYVMPAGTLPPNPSELLESEKTEELLERLKQSFDVIIFDGAPCLLVTDPTILSRIVDSTILVASQKDTKIEDLRNAKKQIENVGGHIAGVVLNRVKVSNKKYESRYYYSSDNKRKRKEESFYITPELASYYNPNYNYNSQYGYNHNEYGFDNNEANNIPQVVVKGENQVPIKENNDFLDLDKHEVIKQENVVKEDKKETIKEEAIKEEENKKVVEEKQLSLEDLVNEVKEEEKVKKNNVSELVLEDEEENDNIIVLNYNNKNESAL